MRVNRKAATIFMPPPWETGYLLENQWDGRDRSALRYLTDIRGFAILNVRSGDSDSLRRIILQLVSVRLHYPLIGLQLCFESQAFSNRVLCAEEPYYLIAVHGKLLLLPPRLQWRLA